MPHLNMLKMIGLVVLLAIALTLPSVLPEPDIQANDREQQQGNPARKADTV